MVQAFNSKKQFVEEISEGVTVVKFGAEWCSPCKQVEKVLATKQDLHHIYKVDVDELAELAGEYGIMSIPTTFVFLDGKIVEKMIGNFTEDQLVTALSKAYDQ